MLLARVPHPHLLPVVGKLFATIETHHIRTSLGSDRWPGLSPLGDRETHALMPTSKQCIENRHLLLHFCHFCETQKPCLWFNRLHAATALACEARPTVRLLLSSAVKPQFVSWVARFLPRKNCCSLDSPTRTQVAISFFLRMFKKSKEKRPQRADTAH